MTSGDIRQGLIGEASHHVTTEALEATSLRLYPPGTLLIAMYGEGRTRGSVGELGIAATTNQACAAVRLHDPSLKDWVRTVLESRYQSMRRMAAGGVQPNLNLRLVRSISIPVPTLGTANRLLTRLDMVLQSIGPTRRELEHERGRAAALRRGLLEAAFTGRLTGRDSDMEVVEELAQ